MEEKYINKILNFADENISKAEELIINKEQAKKIIKELEEDYIPKAIIKLVIANYKKAIEERDYDKLRYSIVETNIAIDVLQELIKEKNIIPIHIDSNTKISIELEEIEKQIAKQFNININLDEKTDKTAAQLKQEYENKCLGNFGAF